MKTFKKQIESKDFKPHMMYDPKTGKGYKAEKEKDHLRMKDMGYTHDKPEVKEAEDPDIGHEKGSQPAVYYKGVSKSKKMARKKHFDKHGDAPDNKKSAYEPAPGDDVDTKPSKHTKKASAMGMGPKDEGKSPHPKGSEKYKAHMAAKHANMKEGDGLWHNINKKRKEGRPMRKPGEQGAPTKQDFKNARGESVEINESEGLKNKAEKSGMPLGILKKVYNRGMAAWKTGHRPGTTPQQWGMARVNSFITKSSGTWGKADKDLASKVRKEEIIHNSEITLLEKQIEELSKFLATKVKGGGVGKHSDKLKKLQRELDAMQKSKFGKSADNSDEDAINNKKNANRKDLRFKPDSYDKIDLKKYHKYSGAKQHVNAESKTFSDFKSSLYEDAPAMSMGGGHIASRDILLGNPNHDKMIRRNMTPIDTEDKRYKKKKRQGETVMLKRFKGNF